MRKHHSTWRIWIGILGLALLLNACGGTTNPTTSSKGTPTSTSAPSSSGSVNTTSTVSFTASGGLTGVYTFSDSDTASNYNKFLGLSVHGQIHGQKWVILLQISNYTGPGTYTLKITPPSGFVELLNDVGAKRWSLMQNSTCQMSITSDTSLTSEAGNVHYHEVKGSFSCPSLVSQSFSPLTLSNGQFDVVALVVP